MKKPIKVTIDKTMEYTDLQQEIMSAGSEELSDEELKKKMAECQPKEIKISQNVIKFLEENNIKLEDFLKEFKEKAGIE